MCAIQFRLEWLCLGAGVLKTSGHLRVTTLDTVVEDVAANVVETIALDVVVIVEVEVAVLGEAT